MFLPFTTVQIESTLANFAKININNYVLDTNSLHHEQNLQNKNPRKFTVKPAKLN